MWLRFYTNHGQKLEMVNFVGQDLEEAIDFADDKSFELIVSDSTFVIGKKGGIILDQNPKPKSFVKENRKVYVTITKFDPDKIAVSDLPTLYGNDINQKLTELSFRGISGKIKSRKYDPGEPNHILEVYYKGKLIIDADNILSDLKINKGDELEFVVSDKESGEIIIPNLVCYAYQDVEFILSSNKLVLGEVTQKGTIDDINTAYVLAQEPSFDGVSKINMESKVNITIVKDKPGTCK